MSDPVMVTLDERGLTFRCGDYTLGLCLGDAVPLRYFVEGVRRAGERVASPEWQQLASSEAPRVARLTQEEQ